MDEFSRIARFFAPLAAGYAGGFGLKDDAATLTFPASRIPVITQDTLVEHVHFTGAEPPHLLAQKALRVNLSDLAAKGAIPFVYLLSLSLPERCDDAWLEDFTQGLKLDQSEYRITLIGGDSTASLADIVITITAIGLLPEGATMQKRSSAQAGDALLVTGTIGDGALGLEAAQGTLNSPALLARYQLPEPRTALATLLHDFATASMDVSDGLLQDAQHLAAQSGLRAAIQLEQIPLSPEAAQWASQDAARLLQLATGGDDYEILCTCPAEKTEAFQKAARAIGIPLTHIGELKQGSGLALTHGGSAVPLPSRLGFQHCR